MRAATEGRPYVSFSSPLAGEDTGGGCMGSSLREILLDR
jgi:hypothetical protein